MYQRASVAVAIAVSMFVVAPVARGEIVEFRFEGSLIDVFGTYSGDDFSLRLGDPVAYSYVIDLETPDLATGGGLGVYDFLSTSVEVGGQTSTATDPGFLRVDTFDAFDEVTAESSGFFGYGVSGAVLELRGPFALETDSIPIDFDLADFPTRLFGFGLDAGDDGWLSVQSSVDQYTMTVIPGAGGAMAMVASACLLTGGRRRTARARCPRILGPGD